MQYAKVKSVAKVVEVQGERLQQKILRTMHTISQLVGSTLGPGGRAVLIERQEENLPGMVTKDGVTVFRNIGFDDPTEHCIMEAARDASVRTASEAGDGTTTATILSEAIVRFTSQYCGKNPRVSPQRVVRRLEQAFKEVMEPRIRQLSVLPDSTTEDGQAFLHAVASISANGDTQLADAVMECFRIVGDEGNVTLTEISGPSGYEVEHIQGYPIGVGYEESCAKFYPKFINDQGNQRTILEKPGFVVYHGRITEVQQVVMLMEKIGAAWQTQNFRHNIVLVATGFSESVLGQLALNFAEPHTINVVPLLAPMTILQTGQLGFLEDICAVTGAKLLDSISNPIEQADLDAVGLEASSFEATRFRSTVVADPSGGSELLVLERVDALKKQAENAASILDAQLIEERIGKLTGGIAKLKVVGASNGELREKRDRAEDAVCAVRGAIKHGTLPGGAWTLLRLFLDLENDPDPVVQQVLRPALLQPHKRLLANCGMSEDEIALVRNNLLKFMRKGEVITYDALNETYVAPYRGGVLDSTPAVLEAVRNSISIASLLGTLGGTVVFKRDTDLERQEARDTNEFLRNANYNPADERA